jgi:hypothetical protein
MVLKLSGMFCDSSAQGSFPGHVTGRDTMYVQYVSALSKVHARPPLFISSTTLLDLGHMPEVYYYDFYRVLKFSLITEIPKYIYKSFSFTCLPSLYYHTCIYKITAKRAQNKQPGICQRSCREMCVEARYMPVLRGSRLC